MTRELAAAATRAMTRELVAATRAPSQRADEMSI
jgi:hypothetical protein